MKIISSKILLVFLLTVPIVGLAQKDFANRITYQKMTDEK